jgi:mono/diheme cytochrome c family protein
MLSRLAPLAASCALLCAGCWQMAEQPSVRPYESPQLNAPPGSVARNPAVSALSSAEAAVLPNPLPPTQATVVLGQLAYRRHCWPCHGPQMDGQSATVGPSLPRGRLNLLDPEVIGQSDGTLYWKTLFGSGNHPALSSTMTSTEAWQTVSYMRAVEAGTVAPGAPPNFQYELSTYQILEGTPAEFAPPATTLRKYPVSQ